jgi:hypothetical protein
MIKYAEIPEYINCGPIGNCFSHIYQFRSNFLDEYDLYKLILIHAYDIPCAKVFKGYILEDTKTYKNILLKESEKEILYKFIGNFEEVSFEKFLEDNYICKDYLEYKEKK